jgi:hypothetical protein
VFRWLRIALVAVALLAAGRMPASAQTADEHHDTTPAGPSDLVAHAFGSLNWRASDAPASPNSFGLGQFALFVTKAIDDRVSVLAEVVMEASSANTRVTTDLERLQLTYHLNDFANLSAGRYHTGLGYYNAAFHHGSYFETPIGRPRVFTFEDEGGVLPVHEVGLSARGKIPKTESALRYVAEVGNGRRWTDLDDEEGLDQNRTKSTNVGLSLRPERWHGAELGVSFYRDRISAAGGLVAHRITAVYAVYTTPAAELLAEWLQLSHRLGTDPVQVTHAGYVQASRAFGAFRPYYRYDRLDIDSGAPLIGAFGSSAIHVIGLRLDPTDRVGLKAQYERVGENDRALSNGVRTQLVFVF